MDRGRPAAPLPETQGPEVRGPPIRCSSSGAVPVLGLVNLQYLSLVGFNNLKHPALPPLCQRPANPTPLHRLSCFYCLGLTRILPSLLSLFTVHTLVIDVHPDEPPYSPWGHLAIPPASVTIQDLILERSDGPNIESYYQFFERVLAPGSLRAPGTRAAGSLKFGLPLSQFLRCDAVRDLLSISVEVPALLETDDRGSTGVSTVCLEIRGATY